MITKGVNDIKPNSHEKIKHTRSFDLKFIIRFENEKDYNFFTPFHWHNHIEVIHVIDGTMEFKIQNRVYELNSGDTIIVNSELIHSSRLLGEVSYYLLQVPLSAFEGIEKESLYFKEQLSDSESKLISKMLDKMLKSYESQNAGSQTKFISEMYELFSILISDYQDAAVVESRVDLSSTQKKIAAAISYVEKNFREEIPLSEIASRLSVSPEYFCRQFKKATGMTLNDYIMSLRISSFYSEFINSDKKISVLMDQNGIKNYKTFLREFKKIYGNTPEALRTQKS